MRSLGTPSSFAARRARIFPVRILGQVGQLKESDRDVLVERYVRGRSSGEIAKLLKVKTGTITRRLRRAEERFGKAVSELSGVQPINASAEEFKTFNGTEWPQERNTRRCELIDGEIEGALTADEQSELNQLKARCWRSAGPLHRCRLKPPASSMLGRQANALSAQETSG
ncbi:hypothetical protein GC176_12135 [bacterium]|nr:hypothetical protein [bacterium]